MFRVTVEKSFSASHRLRLPDGSREKKHRHKWLVRATVAAAKLDSMGLVMDFQKLLRILDNAVKPLAGADLETLKAFRTANSSAENVARYIYNAIGKHLDKNHRLESVEVMETPGCWAKYSLD